MLNDDFPRSATLGQETQWDRILALRDPAQREQALREICELYRGVILAMCRRWDKQEGEDLTHSFMLWLIQTGRLELADPARGRFRNYLNTLLTNFLRKHHRYQQAKKRGGGVEHVDCAEETYHPALQPEDRLFDREWAQTLIGRVIKALNAEATGPGLKTEVLRALLPFLLVEEDGVQVSWEAEAKRLGEPAVTLRSQAHRLRQRFRELLEREVSAYCSASEAAEEIRYLMRALAVER